MALPPAGRNPADPNLFALPAPVVGRFGTPPIAKLTIPTTSAVAAVPSANSSGSATSSSLPSTAQQRAPGNSGQLPSSGNSATNASLRRRTGCLTCRQRKVRCDLRRDVCSNCERLSLYCDWTPVSRNYKAFDGATRGAATGATKPSHTVGPAVSGPQSATARPLPCTECRAAQTKCSSTLPCTRCSSKGLTCFYAEINTNPVVIAQSLNAEASNNLARDYVAAQTDPAVLAFVGQGHQRPALPHAQGSSDLVPTVVEQTMPYSLADVGGPLSSLVQSGIFQAEFGTQW